MMNSSVIFVYIHTTLHAHILQYHGCSVLVGIYGSADYFIKEYCNLLADRLLGSLSYDISHEVSSYMRHVLYTHIHIMVHALQVFVA